MIQSKGFARYALSAIAASMFVAASAQAAKISKSDYEAVKAQAKQTYEASIKSCASLAGNAKDVCKLKAKAERVKEEESAEAAYKNTPKAAHKARLDIAKAQYKLEKEMCDEKTGNAKDVCKKEASQRHVAAKADADAQLKSKQAWADAAEAKNDAAYKTEREKCDALAGEAKDVCVTRVKEQFKR